MAARDGAGRSRLARDLTDRPTGPGARRLDRAARPAPPAGDRHRHRDLRRRGRSPTRSGGYVAPGDQLRRQRRAPGLPRGGLDRHRRPARRCWSSWSARCRCGPGASCSSTVTAATSRRSPARSSSCATKGTRRRLGALRRRRVDAHAGHTETSLLLHLAPWLVRLAPRRARQHPAARRAAARADGARRRGGLAQRRARRPDRCDRRRRAPSCSSTMVETCLPMPTLSASPWSPAPPAGSARPPSPSCAGRGTPSPRWTSAAAASCRPGSATRWPTATSSTRSPRGFPTRCWPSSPTSATARRSSRPSTPPSSGSAGSTPSSPRPASSSAARPSGRRPTSTCRP